MERKTRETVTDALVELVRDINKNIRLAPCLATGSGRTCLLEARDAAADLGLLEAVNRDLRMWDEPELSV